jgi:hypothetical protein
MNKYLTKLRHRNRFGGLGSHQRNLGYPGAYDGKMVKNRLRTIERMARILNKRIKEDDTLPRWTTDLIATSEDRLVMVTDYLISKMEK